MIGSASSSGLTPSLSPMIAPAPPIVASDTSLYQAIACMDSMTNQCVLVVQDTRIVGILSQSEIFHLITTKANLETTLVSQVMCSPVQTISLEQVHATNLVLRLLNSQAVKFLPVIDDQQQVIGVITPETLCQQLEITDQLKVTPIDISSVDSDSSQQTVLGGDCYHTIYRYKHGERPIRKVCEALNTLLNHTPFAVIEWDNHFRVRGWSSQAENLFGWKARDVLEKHPEEWQFIYESDLEAYREMMATLLSDRGSRESCLSYRNYTAKGEVILCEWYHATLIDAAGAVVSILSLVLDVTRQKQAEEQLKQQLAAIETSIDGIAILDANGCYTYLNRAHTRLLGYDNAEQLLGKSWQDIYSEDESHQSERGIFQTIAQQGYWRGEVVGKRQDGNLVTQEIALTRLDDGGLTCICRDVTARKLFEYELLRSRAELETRIEERTEELQSANTYLQAEIVKREKLTRELAQAKLEILQALEQEKELNELKSRFITNTSHEFRTPLTIILGSLELLEYSSENWNVEKKKKHYQRIRASVQHMTQLLDDVLTLNQTDASFSLIYTPSLIDVQGFCHSLLDEIRSGISTQHTIHLTCDNPPFLAELDGKLLRHILSNLLVNAIKYSPNGGSIFLDVQPVPEGVLMQVRDQGIGIPKADLSRLFEPFHRASNVKTISGNGLGLTIVKQAVDLHGGEITLNSEVDVGTVFTVKLPARMVYQEAVSAQYDQGIK